jgi:hypothetical protein
MDHDIRQVSVTSRSNDKQLDLALSTDKGLFFASLAFSTIGRTTQFTVKLTEEKYLLERQIASLVEYEQDKFVVLVQEINKVAFLDRNLKNITTLPNPTTLSTYYSLRQIMMPSGKSGAAGSKLIFFRDSQYVSVLDIVTMKIYKLLKAPI